MKNTKKFIIALDVCLMIGLFAHSIIFLFINKYFPPESIAMVDVNKRMIYRQAAEMIGSVCGFFYIAGHIAFLYRFTIRKLWPSFRTILLYFVLQIFLLFLGTIPFALFDLAHLGDYVFPLWNIGIDLVILFLIAAGISYFQKRKQ